MDACYGPGVINLRQRKTAFATRRVLGRGEDVGAGGEASLPDGLAQSAAVVSRCWHCGVKVLPGPVNVQGVAAFWPKTEK